MALLCTGCFENGSPTAPSEPRQEARVAGVTFTVTGVALTRDFMPVVLEPGPDGGRPLTGVVRVSALAVGGNDQRRFYAGAVVFDQEGNGHRLSAVVRERDALTLWDGSLAPGETKALEVALSGGPFLPVGSRAGVVVEWTAQNGDRGTLHIPGVEVAATH